MSDDEVSPAYAGMIPILLSSYNVKKSEPRIRGDDPDTLSTDGIRIG